MLPATTHAGELDVMANTLGLKYPIEVDISHMFADGGTVGMSITDVDGKILKLSYDGRQEVRERLFGSKTYHIYLEAFHPSHDGAAKLPICSPKETAAHTIIKDWVAKKYPSDWRDTNKYASSSYVMRLIDDLDKRKCK